MTPLNELTSEQILVMPAGREMDAYIAEAMGALWWKSTNTGRRALYPGAPPDWFHEEADMSEGLCYKWDCQVRHWSTDMAVAWELLETLAAIYASMNVWSVDRVYAAPWNVSLEGSVIRGSGLADIESEADTPALAICRAFLLTKIQGKA